MDSKRRPWYDKGYDDRVRRADLDITMLGTRKRKEESLEDGKSFEVAKVVWHDLSIAIIY